jgi:mannose-6-phosphate isomerase-like protein (cupin superfamily)
MGVAEEPAIGRGRSLSVNVEDIKARRGEAPWAERVVISDAVEVVAICQNPGHQNDWHYHLQDEWWFIYQGELSWTIEGQPEPIHVKTGDYILVPANHFHYIQVHGEGPSIRIATTYNGEWHRHGRENKPPAPDGARVD